MAKAKPVRSCEGKARSNPEKVKPHFTLSATQKENPAKAQFGPAEDL